MSPNHHRAVRPGPQLCFDVSSSPPDCSAFRCGWAFLGAGIDMTADTAGQLYVLWNAGSTVVAQSASSSRLPLTRELHGRQRPMFHWPLWVLIMHSPQLPPEHLEIYVLRGWIREMNPTGTSTIELQRIAAPAGLRRPYSPRLWPATCISSQMVSGSRSATTSIWTSTVNHTRRRRGVKVTTGSHRGMSGTHTN
jgi:hypothetical protein